jgi:hypothetical protein
MAVVAIWTAVIGRRKEQIRHVTEPSIAIPPAVHDRALYGD